MKYLYPRWPLSVAVIAGSSSFLSIIQIIIKKKCLIKQLKNLEKKLIRISVGIPYHFAMCIYLKCIDHIG